MGVKISLAKMKLSGLQQVDHPYNYENCFFRKKNNNKLCIERTLKGGPIKLGVSYYRKIYT